MPQRFALARERVRYVGDPIAIVVAERIDQAKDAVEAIDIAFTPRPSVSNLREATRHGAPSLWTEAAGNVAGMFRDRRCRRGRCRDGDGAACCSPGAC